MTICNARAPLVAVLALLALAQGAAAQEKIRVGIIGHFSGPFAMSGRMFKEGIETYLSQHGSTVGGREIELVYRDEGGPNPAAARRLAEELIVSDKVAILGGLYLSPEASAVAAVATETKTPTVLFNPAASPIIRQSPYFIRVGNSIWQDAFPSAEWAYSTGKRKAYIAVADFSAGYDVQEGFKTRFITLGGTIAGEDRMPLNTVDFSPFVERIANADADIVQVFVPSGAPQISFIKTLSQRGVMTKTTVIGLADDTDIPAFDDSAIGYYSISHYAPGLDTKENRDFIATIRAKYGDGGEPITFLTAAAYDGMQVICHMIESQASKPFDGAAAIAAAHNYTFTGPRGSIHIESNGEITDNEYVQRIEKINGHLQNVVVRSFMAVKDPWPAAHP